MRDSGVDATATSASTSGEPLSEVSRRAALAFGLSGCALLLEGCGGGGGSTEQALASPSDWNVGPLYFLVGSGATWDLAATLPSEIVQGGTFGISATGAALPNGMTMSASGILSVGRATAGTVVGVVFTYAEPS